MQVVNTASQDSHDAKSVNASYSRISEAFRHVTAGPLQCQVFCGGKSCKYERSDVWSQDQMAIPGLFSHWVTDSILAMARPNYTEIKKHDMINSFKKAEITAVLNLQESGEHASCGNSLHSSGFSYDPIELMNNDIYYYNFNIQDYSVPLQRTLLDICKVVTFAQTEGRVAIHCHAGLGRTGVVIACFLVYHHKLKPKDAILLVRKNRPRSIQTRNQLKAVFRFANYLTPLWIQLPVRLSDWPDFSLEVLLSNQQIVLHGTEGRTLKHIPKILYMICSWVFHRVGQDTGVLYKKLRSNVEDNRPATCPSTYQFGEADGHDLDSLVGDEDAATGTIREVEELEEEMTPRKSLERALSEECLSDTSKTTNKSGTQVINLSHRLNLSPRSSLNQIGVNKRTKEYVPVSGNDLDENFNLPPSPVSSILQLHNINEDVIKDIIQFLSGICGEPNNDLKSTDLDLVNSQINFGIWESFTTLSPYNMGRLLQRWCTTLTSPILSVLEVEALLRKSNIRIRDQTESTPKYFEKLVQTFEMLNCGLVGTVHCIIITFTLILYGPFNVKRSKILSILKLLLTRGEVKEEGPKHLTSILSALINTKHNEILRFCGNK